MNNKPTVFKKSPAECYAAGYGDSRRFISMYKAYLAGAAAAVDDGEHERLVTRLCMMGLIFAAWALMMILVFKN